MRISNIGFANSVKRTLAAQADRIGTLYGQLSSGKRLQQPGDDPAATVRALRAHATLNELAARQTVARQGQQLIGATDTALGDLASTLSQAKDLCLQANTSTLTAAERGALAAQVRSLSASLVTTGNTEVQGQYLFGGSQISTPPLREDETANLPVLYCGDHQQLRYQAGPDEKLPVGLTGAEVFNYPDATGTRPVAGVDADAFSLLSDLADAIEAGDSQRLEQYGEQLDQLHAHAVDLRGQVGVIAQRWERVQERADSTATLLNQVLADDESVDVTAAIVDLSNLETAYQAALGLTAQMLQLPGLFDQL
ncbi:MAG: flagellar hook-associated protein FlgL [Armatimonadetes bacterium]|nr:flagellar hook-associated protein FlgL [Armatimonadota bacterium]